jgi:hypothetical protein
MRWRSYGEMRKAQKYSAGKYKLKKRTCEA